MDSLAPRASITWREMLKAWARILNGRAPMLSIEITRECPLHCPGCYAYGKDHLGGGTVLRELSDYRGDASVNGVLQLVRKHRPLAGPLKVDHFIQGSIGIGLAMNRFREGSIELPRWLGLEQKPREKVKLIQIES